MARLPRGIGFTVDEAISTGARVGGRGRVSVTGTFKFNTYFPQEFGNDHRVRQRFEELRKIAHTSALRHVPVRSGKLRDSIRSKVVKQRDGSLRIELTAGGRRVPYWAFVEYGTGRRGARSRQHDPGTPTGYTFGASSGQRAQPYLRPALNDVRRRLAKTAGGLAA